MALIQTKKIQVPSEDEGVIQRAVRGVAGPISNTGSSQDYKFQRKWQVAVDAVKIVTSNPLHKKYLISSYA